MSGSAFGAGYAWTVQEPPALDASLATVHRAAPAGLEGALASEVEWVLREAGLIAVLERVTGDAEALHEAAAAWLEQAVALRGRSTRLRQDGAAVAGSWRGDASQSFGAAMGECVAAVDQLASGMAATAQLLNRAGVEAGAAQDAVTGILTDAAAWVAAELAATAVADVLTFGLATVGGALAGSVTLAAFVVRAERISARLGTVLEQVAVELAEVRDARDAIAMARGLSTLRALRQTRATVTELRGTGSVLRAMEGAADAALGEAAGLPLGAHGPDSLGSQIRHTIVDEAERTASGP